MKYLGFLLAVVLCGQAQAQCYIDPATGQMVCPRATPIRTVVQAQPVRSAVRGVYESVSSVKQAKGSMGSSGTSYSYGSSGSSASYGSSGSSASYGSSGAPAVAPVVVPASPACPCGENCPCRAKSTSTTTSTTTVTVTSTADVGVGTEAYADCLREAQEQARRGRVGHLFGVARGARMQGVGSSHSPGSPSHCTGSGLIARAGVQGRDGRWYWSAAYAR